MSLSDVSFNFDHNLLVSDSRLHVFAFLKSA